MIESEMDPNFGSNTNRRKNGLLKPVNKNKRKKLVFELHYKDKDRKMNPWPWWLLMRNDYRSFKELLLDFDLLSCHGGKQPLRGD
jgi:hypothetical protein